ncbi:MAG: hypothetical protein HZA89_12495 [Verrucomicrobia bacterium]|nr:hypothetical protein [Verrucomicrobiota bacterium]
MSFADFPEQHLAAELLQRSLRRGRLAHAYLFIGATTEQSEAVALTLAKTVNCQRPKVSDEGRAFDCCDECSSCQRIAAANHPDIQWLRPESKLRLILIDQIQDLLQTIYLKPSEAGHKVVILTGADRMTPQAANALLKTLEEPPPKSVLILTTTDAGRVLETITSRCLRLNFTAETQRQFSPAQLAFLTAFSQMAEAGTGAPMGRYRLLGVLLAELARLRGEIEAALTSRSPLEKYDDAEPKLREKWEDELTAAIEGEYRSQRSQLLNVIHWWLRDVWMLKTCATDELVHFGQFKKSAETVSNRIGRDSALSNLTVLEKAQRLLNSNVQEALALEVGFLGLNV